MKNIKKFVTLLERQNMTDEEINILLNKAAEKLTEEGIKCKVDKFSVGSMQVWLPARTNKDVNLRFSHNNPTKGIVFDLSSINGQPTGNDIKDLMRVVDVVEKEFNLNQ